MPSRNDKIARSERQERATERQTIRDARSNEDQLMILKARGATEGKEVRRLSDAK